MFVSSCGLKQCVALGVLLLRVALCAEMVFVTVLMYYCFLLLYMACVLP